MKQVYFSDFLVIKKTHHIECYDGNIEAYSKSNDVVYILNIEESNNGYSIYINATFVRKSCIF